MGRARTDSDTAGTIGIVIVAHGRLAAAMLEVVEHVLGRQPHVRTVTIDPDYDKIAKGAEIRAAAESVDTGQGVAVVVDLHGSSPANLCQAVSGPAPRYLLTGANVPMLLKLVQSRDLPLHEAATAALTAGRKYMDGRDLDPLE